MKTETQTVDHIILCDGRKVMVGETIQAGYRGEVTLVSVDQDPEMHCCNCGNSWHPQGERSDYWGMWKSEIDGGFLNGSRIG